MYVPFAIALRSRRVDFAGMTSGPDDASIRQIGRNLTDPVDGRLREYVAHYHAERNHQGVGNAIIAPLPRPTKAVGRVRCRERLGGMLPYYHREAA